MNKKGDSAKMKKLKVYLDTSVISHLLAQDTPEKMADTIKFWDAVRQEVFDVYISDIVLKEIGNCNEPKRTDFLYLLKGIRYTVLHENEESTEFAQKLIENHVLTPKSIDDCRHIALAVINDCGVIASWNFKHIVNFKTIRGVKVVSTLTGYNDIEIFPPTMLIGDDI